MTSERRFLNLAREALGAGAAAAIRHRAANEAEALALPANALLKPFRGARPGPHVLHQIVTPPLASGPLATPPLARSAYEQDVEPGYYVYRISKGLRTATGLVAAASVAAYAGGRIRRHEEVQPQKVDLQRRMLEAAGAEVEPVLLIAPSEPAIEAFLAAATLAEPATAVTLEGGFRHEIWRVADPAIATLLAYVLDSLPALYIADGHHRTAAALEYAKAREAAGEPHPRAPHLGLLAVVMPEDEVAVSGYHRLIPDLGGRDARAFLADIEATFDALPCGLPPAPQGPGEMGLFVENNWYALKPKRSAAAQRGRDLSPLRLAGDILGPLLGIEGTGEGRLDYIPGTMGAEALARRVSERGSGAAFLMPALSVTDIMTAADNGLFLPPKSTWLEPKPARGLLTYSLR